MCSSDLAEAYPAEEISLRSASTENVVIIDITDPAPRVIGEVDLAAAPAFVHEDAIYLHLGQQHHVERLDWDERKAYVRRVNVDYYTDAQIAVDVRVLEEFAQAAGAAHGEVVVTFRPTIFKKLKLATHENVGFGTIHLPETTLHTTGAWWVFPRALVEACGCAEGCPSCVGPVLEVGPQGKQHTLHLLRDVRVAA